MRIALFNASIVSSGSGSDWDTEATGAPPINASNLPVDYAGEGKNSGVDRTEPNGDSSPPTTDRNELLWNGGGVSHPELVSTAAALEDWERECNGDSVSKRDRGEETGGISPPSTNLLLLGTGVDVTPEPGLMILLGPGVDVTPGPVQMLFVGSEVSVTPDPILVFIVGEETGGISLPSAAALMWHAGSETNMASWPESS